MAVHEAEHVFHAIPCGQLGNHIAHQVGPRVGNQRLVHAVSGKEPEQSSGGLLGGFVGGGIERHKLRGVHHNHNNVLVAVFVCGRDSESINTNGFAFVLGLESAVDGLESVAHAKAGLLAHSAGADVIFNELVRNVSTRKELANEQVSAASTVMSNTSTVHLAENLAPGFLLRLANLNFFNVSKELSRHGGVFWQRGIFGVRFFCELAG
mmetsp:Transcript_41151/g.71218  ORF Transcript_41151/g.71218 Transcript_41151/m.71218 type:complete len:209 (+) Transcript_41151:167-793(+)